MRYDTPVTFQLVEDTYDSKGDYTESVKEAHIEYASVVDTDIQTMHLVYGAIRQGSKTLHLQNHIGYTFNRVIIDGVPYVVDQKMPLRVKVAYILSQWQS